MLLCTDFPVYHTAFDSFSWMEKYGDPSFQRHVAGQLSLSLSTCYLTIVSYSDLSIDYCNICGSLSCFICFMFLGDSVAGVWGLLALHLADDTILPFNYVSYASELQVCIQIMSSQFY